MATAVPTQLPQIAPAQPAEPPKPKLSYRATRDFEMRSTTFGESVDEDICKWVWEQIDVRQKQLENRHKHKVPEWRRLASGKPREENKSWPFENCSNLVHPIIGESSDELSARVLQLIWATAPIIKYSYFMHTKEAIQAHLNATKSRLLEQFIDYVAYEPNELDLYRIENLWFHDSTDIGTAWVCVAPEKRVEAIHIGYREKNGRKGDEFENSVLYEGPKVINLRD